jgi:hypothetical protein
VGGRKASRFLDVERVRAARMRVILGGLGSGAQASGRVACWLMTAAPQLEDPLVLRFAGQLVEQLGAQLYPRVTAAVAELVSNAWDADARNVWVTIPFDEKWRGTAVIEVLDDGHGMTRQQAQDRYLVVGLNRRRYGATSEGGRALHGRKGIGKLAAFGTAGLLECVTRRDGELTAFAIDYEKLRKEEPTAPYQVEELGEVEALTNPETGEPLEHGTRVRLTQLRAKRRTGEAVFQRSMARRFALDATKMRVFINRQPLERFDYDVEIRFPRDGVPAGATIEIDTDGWAREEIDFSSVSARVDDADGQAPASSSAKDEPPDGSPAPHTLPTMREVRWWIGFTATPIADEDTRGISILARGKLAQRPFMFESAQGTTGQLGQEYLVGEVSADWLDHGTEAEDDLIQSNRDQLQLDNAELAPLLDWGRERLRWALAQRNKVRRDQRTGPDALGKRVEAVLDQVPARSRERLRTLAGRIAEFTQGDEQDVARAVEAVLQASDASTARRAGEQLRLEGDPDEEATWTLLRIAADAADDSRIALLQTRIDALEQFGLAVAEPPAQRLHREIAANPWIISPLLDGVPSRVLQDDEHRTVVAFDALPPLFNELTVTCWAVGVQPTETPDAAGARVLSIASAWTEAGPDRLTWKQTIVLSRETHQALVAARAEA